jgi:cell wall assembly regulator SMI1
MGKETNRVEEACRRIRSWFAAHPEGHEEVWGKLLPGVPEEAIARVERGIARELPEDLKAFWRFCGGAMPWEGSENAVEPWWSEGEWSADLFPASIPHVTGFSVLSPRAALESWQSQREWEGIDEHWLPIATNGGGDYQYVDLSPDPAHHGAIVEFEHEEGKAKRLAGSMADFLEEIASGLESGDITYEEGHGLARTSNANHTS